VREAAALRIPEHEGRLGQNAEILFRQPAPFHILLKAGPWLYGT
jgi:hypothetical protein